MNREGRKMNTKWLLFLALVGTTACGGSDDKADSYADYEISGSDLSGEINGQSWAFSSGIAEDFGDGEYWITLYSVEPMGDDPCAFDAYAFEEPSVFVVAPLEETDVELSLNDNITFYYYEDDTPTNEIVIDGRLIIEEVTDTTVSGALYGVSDDSELDGQFDAVVCP
jgi:hypothetical protein